MQTLRPDKCSKAPRALSKATAWLASALVLSLSVGAHAQTPPPMQAPTGGPSAPVQAPPPPAPQSPPIQGPSPEAPPAAPDTTGTVPPEVVQEVPPAIEQAPAPVMEEMAPPLETTADITAPAEPPSHRASYALWTASGVSLAVGTVFGVLALKAKNDFDDGPTYERADTAHDRAIIADVGLGLGLILAVTGTVFYFDDDDTEETAKLAPRQRGLADVRVAPFVHRSASGGTLSLRF